MKKIINNNGAETIIYAETFEYSAYDQVKMLINYEPYLNSKIRIMPDGHAGAGCVVGTTMTIIDSVTPNLVGVDIGCGMLTVRLGNTKLDLSKLDDIIKNKIPSGFNINEKSNVKFKEFDDLLCGKFVDLKRANLSLGTLGGGNHFIEVGKSKNNGDLYLIIHSGSRKLGVDTCKYYQDLAFSKLNEMSLIRDELISKLKSEGRHSEISNVIKSIKKPSANKQLAHLTGNDFHNYMHDMKIVQNYAILNRSTIADIIIRELKLVELDRFETIHNYIDFRRMILRKGAVSAENGEKLLIPMNMRDGSLICVGKGNPDWNFSAPHGAGRLMSRSVAKEMLTLNEFHETMSGIYTTSVCESTIDEAPDAYKPMGEIMSLIGDTVDVVDVLKPIYNYKAH